MGLNQIDSRVVEMLLLEPFIRADVSKSVMKFERKMNDEITLSSNLNPSTTPINTLNHVRRMIKDSLPGYFLGRTLKTDPLQNEGTLQYVEVWGALQKVRSSHVLMYFSNPERLVDNQVHKLIVITKGFKTNPTESDTLLALSMEVQIKRVNNNLEFEVYSNGGSLILQSTLTGVDFNKFLYMGLTTGQGILFYKSDHEVVSRLELTVSFYQSGHLKEYFHRSVQMPPFNLNKIFKTADPAGQTIRRWTSVNYLSPQGNDHNEIGVRVFQLVYGIGAYPFHLIAENDLRANYERCFWQGFKDNQCLGMALLLDSSEPQVNVLHQAASDLKTVTDPQMLSGCRVPLDEKNCIIPKNGYIVNLDTDQTTPLSKNLLSAADYSNSKQEHRDFFAEYLVDPGNPNSQKFLLSCPYECNL